MRNLNLHGHSISSLSLSPSIHKGVKVVREPGMNKTLHLPEFVPIFVAEHREG